MDEGRSQAERAYRRLRAEILHGDLMPGERLAAADLHARFGLGLTPIREALMRLSSEGLVAGESHRGAWVSDASPAELADLMETRRAVERLCLERAMARGDAAWEGAIISAMHVLARTPLPGSPADRRAAAEWEIQHRRFHHALVASCGSAWLLRFWNTLVDHSERYRKIRVLRHQAAEAEVRDVTLEHRAIMEAVLARDPAAADLMDSHLLATERSVARLLTQA